MKLMIADRSKQEDSQATPTIARWPWRGFGIAGVAIVLILGPFRYRFFSVCDQCGILRHTDCRELPVFNIPYWCSQRDEETQLSRTVARLRLIEPHEHHWQFGAGGRLFSLTYNGPGITTVPVLKSELVSTFLENTQAFAGNDVASAWLSFLLNAEHRKRILNVLEFTHFPATGFASAAEYRKWRTTAEDELREVLGNPPADPSPTSGVAR